MPDLSATSTCKEEGAQGEGGVEVNVSVDELRLALAGWLGLPPGWVQGETAAGEVIFAGFFKAARTFVPLELVTSMLGTRTFEKTMWKCIFCCLAQLAERIHIVARQIEPLLRPDASNHEVLEAALLERV